MAATAIVVPFYELDAVVGRHRRALTSDGAVGMPAHVTLIYPFIDAHDLGDPEIVRLQSALAAFSAFDVTFTRFGGFAVMPPVLYLEPDPARPLLDMIAAVAREFPGFPPLGGIHETVVPHLTIAQTDDAAAMRAAEDDVSRRLPIRTHVAEAAIMRHGEEGWRPRERVALSPA